MSARNMSNFPEKCPSQNQYMLSYIIPFLQVDRLYSCFIQRRTRFQTKEPVILLYNYSDLKVYVYNSWLEAFEEISCQTDSCELNVCVLSQICIILNNFSEINGLLKKL